jgi:hypothetical protein
LLASIARLRFADNAGIKLLPEYEAETLEPFEVGDFKGKCLRLKVKSKSGKGTSATLRESGP